LKIDIRRARMVEVQIAGRGIRDQRVLRAMRGVPREVFVDAGLEQFAYEDVLFRSPKDRPSHSLTS
jgi:protein-L-isoaspartate O-methyltransferase